MALVVKAGVGKIKIKPRPIPSSGNSYYVSTSGTGNGTIGSPWGIPDLFTVSGINVTSGAALTTLQPGDTLYFRGGSYVLTPPATLTQASRPLMVPTQSGTSGAPITLRSYPGEIAAISFNPSVISTYPAFGDWYGSTFLQYIRFLGFDVTMGPWDNVNNVGNTSAFICWGDHLEIGFCKVTGLDNHYTDNHDGIRVNGSQNPYLVPPVRYADGPWIHHTEVTGVLGTTPGNNYLNNAGIKFYQVKNAIIEDNYIHANGSGFFDKSNGSNNTIRRNWLTDNNDPAGSGKNYCGNNEFGVASGAIYDNVIDGSIELSYANSGIIVNNNLIRTTESLFGTITALWTDSDTTTNSLPGTVSCTTGSPIVTGSGTTFILGTSPAVVAGSYIRFSADSTGTIYQVLSIQDNTHLTLTANIAASANGSGQTATLCVFSINVQAFNNIIISGGTSAWGYMTKYSKLGDALAPITTLDYNVYDATPIYEFGHYAVSGPVDYTLTSIRVAGHETHSAFDSIANIVVNQTAYVVKAPYTTAGNTGGTVGPRTTTDGAGHSVATADILNTARYGPSAIGSYV